MTILLRVFVDTSVFFSACYSQKGASHEIFQLAAQNEIRLVTSYYILEETRRNLANKSPADLTRFLDFQRAIEMEQVNPTKDNVLEAAAYTALKDAPVVAAARLANVDCLVSLDRKHLIGRPEVARRSGLRIVLPEAALKFIRETNQGSV